MAVGRPIKLTPNVARKIVSITATASQTTFTPTGGYRIGELAVYRNGVRLANGRDFTAVDGANVILQQGANVGDVTNATLNFEVGSQLTVTGISTLKSDTYVGIDTARGVVLTSPNGTAYRLIVSNAGALSAVAV